MNEGDAKRLMENMELFEQLFDGLGFCLSEEGDLLSQWRGYASDGSGVAIGFSAEYLRWLASKSLGKDRPGFSLQQVQYDPKKQQEQIEPTYREVKKLIDEGVFRMQIWGLLYPPDDEKVKKRSAERERKLNELSLTLLSLFPKLYVMKAPAFREEREWRLISYFTRSLADQCLYRTAGEKIIPYRSFALEDPTRALKEVILGPKHRSPAIVVQQFLKSRGFGDVVVKQSEATYR